MIDFQTTLTDISLSALEAQRWEDDGGSCSEQVTRPCVEQASELEGCRVMSDVFTAEDEQLIAAASAGSRPVQVGDIFESNWGYDQTNVDFYLVVSLTKSGKSVKLVNIGQTLTERRGPAGDRVIPDPERVLCHRCGQAESDRIHTEGEYRWGENHVCTFDAKPTVHRLGTGYRGRPSIKVRSWGVWAYPWVGVSHYQTDTAFGH